MFSINSAEILHHSKKINKIILKQVAKFGPGSIFSVKITTKYLGENI